jgi:cellulose synthase/poly-beta-1,6-N-acetylglucosamine synthase-like glycosyltransferase
VHARSAVASASGMPPRPFTCGCTVNHGRVENIRTPRSILALFQAVEYLRAFLGGRVAFSYLNSLLLISGAFGLFRKDAVIEVGGFATSTLGEDMELVVRLHDVWNSRKGGYRIYFVPEPVCWTEVPESLKVLHRQRNRWQRGTVESLSLHRRMILNPRFGVVGMFALPYFFLFEMLGPMVELLGYVLTILGLLFGIIRPEIAAPFFVVSVLFGILLSVSSVLLEEFTTSRYPSTLDLLLLVGAAVIENFGFRQLLTIWRAQGLIDGLRGKKGWGAMQRKGFQSS